MKLKAPRKIVIFNNKYPLVGPVVWVLSVQYFLAQILVVSSWPVPHTLKNNLISDLGNTECGQYAGRYVCSPDHMLMNISFITLGLTMALGSLLIYQSFRQSQASLVGFSLMGLAGIGSMLVGLFPENSVSQLHAIGAFLALFLGNLSLVVLSVALHRVRKIFRIYTFISGMVSILAFVLFTSGNNLGLGPGGMERLVSYPQTLWLILFGLYMSGSHIRKRKNTSNKPLVT